MGMVMVDGAKGQREIRRLDEVSRLEERLWKRVFEELWPVVMRSTGREPADDLCPHSASQPVQHAKGA